MSTLKRAASSSCWCTSGYLCCCKLSSTVAEGSPCANWMTRHLFPTNPKLQRMNQQTGLQRFLHGVWIHYDCTLSQGMLWSEWTFYKYPSDPFTPDATRSLSKWLPLVQSSPTHVSFSGISSVIWSSSLTFHFVGSYHSSCHRPWTSFLPYTLLHCPHIKSPILLQNIVDPILVVAMPARSPAALSIGTFLVISLQSVWRATSSDMLWNFHPVGCNPNDTWMIVTCHMRAYVLSNLRSAHSQISAYLYNMYDFLV